MRITISSTVVEIVLEQGNDEQQTSSPEDYLEQLEELLDSGELTEAEVMQLLTDRFK